MVGQMLLEDEYVINVKVRRPIDGPCPPPPTFTVACHDARTSEFDVTDYRDLQRGLLPHDKFALPATEYIGAFTIGPDKQDKVGFNGNSLKPIEWKTQYAPPEDQWDFKKHTSVTMRPGNRKIYTEDSSQEKCLKDPPDSGALRSLPQVKVYGDDMSLIATNVFKAPPKDQESKPSQTGSLYVERIADHCKSTSGELYVPPVQEAKLKDSKIGQAAMRGNSRRTESERILAKMNKKSFPSIVQKPLNPQARENLSCILENEVVNGKNEMYESYPRLSLPYNAPAEKAPLKFPTPQECTRHPCPRWNQLNNSVHLSQSSTLFPTTPAGKTRHQSFNVPPSRSDSSSSLPTNLTDCQPHYSSVFPGMSCQLGSSNSFTFHNGHWEQESTDEEYSEGIEFFRTPNSMRNRSPSSRNDHSELPILPSMGGQPPGEQSRFHDRRSPFDHKHSTPDNYMRNKFDHASLLSASNAEQSYFDGEYAISSATVSDSSPERCVESSLHGKPQRYCEKSFSFDNHHYFVQPTNQSHKNPYTESRNTPTGSILGRNAKYGLPEYYQKSESMIDLDHEKTKSPQHIRFANQGAVGLGQKENFSRNKTSRGKACDLFLLEPVPARSCYSGGPLPRISLMAPAGSAHQQLAQNHHLPPTRTYFPKDVYRQRCAESRVRFQGDHHAGDPNSSRATLTSQSSRGSVKSSDARNQLDETDSFARGKENRSLFADRGSRPDRVVTEDRAHEINSSFQRKKPGTAMLVTEQPLVFGSTAHLYDNQDGRESLETEDPADKYLFRNDSTLSANVDQFRQLDRQFPNGFPDFNGQFRTSGGDSALNGKFKTNGADFFVKNFVKRNNGHFDNLGGFDAGYSSEKSPEEEEPPSCFDIETVPSSRDQTESPVHEEQTTGISDQVVEEKSLIQQLVEDGVQLTTATVMNVYPFINEGTLFDVTLEKNSRGLGLSLCGGRESKGPHAGLLRVKKLYPQMPAWLCGQLRVGDIILEANCTVMTGLTSHEALEVLRTTRTSGVHLLLCRPPSGGLLGDDDVLASPTAPTRPLEVVSTSLLGEQGAYSDHLMPPSPHSMCGEFEVTLAKVKGSLGFTLRKRDNSVLGHTIRTLVRDPALSDGRIKPGDKILSVNNQDLCGLSHEEAIAFLRTTPDVVTIRLYRDVTQTPVSPLSPTEPDPSPLNPKPLRQEARDMLSDLRKRASPHSASPGLDTSHSPSPGNPRRRRLQKSSTSDVTKASIVERFDMLLEGTEEASQNPQVCPALAGDRDLTNRDSCASTLSANSTIISRHASSASTETNSDASETLRRTRPNFLDLENRQSCTRKTQFSPPHEIEDSFPSPSDDDVNYEEYLDSIGSVDSAPACNNAQSVSPSFAYSQPGYQSVNFGASNYQDHGRITGTSSDFTLSSHLKNTSSKVCQKSGLMKWKGTYMGQDESDQDADEEENAADCGLAKSRRKKVVTIELHRGWNSRLGFSLKADGEATRVVAVYAGCVAAKDGRLKVGDEIISVNDEDVTQWSTCDVIDRLRKTHGKIVLKVLQQPF
ncbi:uncharacterized protein LOC108682377 isoform X1 [Hyalella azteca]|uniref:Uncharacterized protein LOC108682377 isoform X1 n=1 Tax=Hyalella azteca TaxID=294128 RepID=A0A8B7PNL1_HYAAZ|nr:uncharacterized protein LOC108682377 isoform X1 [Hyalella azteca]